MAEQRDLTMLESQDTEITLGTGKLLGIFFLLVVVCALFFGLGFNFGRATTPQNETTLQAIPPTLTVAGGAKPSPSHVAPAPPADCPLGQDCTQAANTPALDSNPAATTTSAAAVQPTATGTPAPELGQTSTGPATAAAVPTFVVQVAAVTRKEDAEALMGALKQKSYPVFVVADPDKLFHVQVGPFADKKDAQTMRDKLSGDGYNPIMK
jgi:DedD protein